MKKEHEAMFYLAKCIEESFEGFIDTPACQSQLQSILGVVKEPTIEEKMDEIIAWWKKHGHSEVFVSGIIDSINLFYGTIRKDY